MRVSVKVQFTRVVAENEPQRLGSLHKTYISALVEPTAQSGFAFFRVCTGRVGVRTGIIGNMSLRGLTLGCLCAVRQSLVFFRFLQNFVTGRRDGFGTTPFCRHCLRNFVYFRCGPTTFYPREKRVGFAPQALCGNSPGKMCSDV